MSCPSIGVLNNSLTFSIQVTGTSGEAQDADSNPLYSIYENSTGTPILTGSMSKLSNQEGFYTSTIAVSSANNFEVFATYNIQITATVDGIDLPTVFSFICLGSEAANASVGASTSGSAWSITKAKITQQIEHVVRKLSGGSQIDFLDKQIIGDAINMAMLDIVMETGTDRWRFLRNELSEDTTVGIDYIDLDDNVFRIHSGTVKIASQDQMLQCISSEDMASIEPEKTTTGIPIVYSLESSGIASSIRLKLYPIPDNIYTISYIGETLVDEDSITSFPPYMHGMLSDKAMATALTNLGMANYAEVYERNYLTRKQNVKLSINYDGPEYINRYKNYSYKQSIQQQSERAGG